MTKAQIKTDIQMRDDDWLESRWSVLNEAITKIEPHLAEVEAAFDYDYGVTRPTPESLEQSVCDQVLALCNVVTTHDTEGTVSWGELLELIDLEIKRREKPVHIPQGFRKFVEVEDDPDGVSMKLDPPAEKPSGILSLDPGDISELVVCGSVPCPECKLEGVVDVGGQMKVCPTCDGLRWVDSPAKTEEA